MNIVIVEDDFRIAQIHEEMIAQLPYCNVVYTALNAEDAKLFLQQSELIPDLFLVDIYIPDVQGLSFVEYLRTSFPYSNVIIASAANDQKTVMAAKKLGVFDYLVKPIEQQRLLASFQRYHKELTNDYEHWTQPLLDQLFHTFSNDTQQPKSGASSLPKGIDQLTLDNIMTYLVQMDGESITAQELTEEMGMSRSTARRYLEYLDAIQLVDATLHYGHVGRPQRRYVRREQNEQN